MAEKASYSFQRSHGDIEAFQMGQLGDPRGKEWSYEPKGAITGIMVSCNQNNDIHSLVFKSVDENGNFEYSDTIGCHYKSAVKVMLDWPEEYFTSVSGTINLTHYYFASLSFTTNRKKYGPFGNNSQGTPFEFPMKDRVIVGFYGRIYDDLHIFGGLGVYVKHSKDLFGPNSSQVIQQVVNSNNSKVGSFNQEECIKVGPWGWPRSSTDEEWSYMLKGGATTVIKIGFNGDYIKWISFKSSDEKCEVKHSVQNCNTNNDESHEVISLNWPEEYLVSITGTLRAPMKDVESLCFYTNQTIYGPFGLMKKTGIPFRFYMKGGIIVGFHGRVGDYFDALGAYIKPFSGLFNSSGQIENTEVKAGPFGGQGGKQWVYQPNDAITEITISHGWVIDSLSFKSVDKNGKAKYSNRFGGEGGDTSDLIKIDWPREYLTSISGTHHTFLKQHVIESLCFQTNKKKHGPFGRTQGSPFDIPLKDRAIVGFHGRANNYIDAIGVYQKGPSS